jgi:hypothetical protein
MFDVQRWMFDVRLPADLMTPRPFHRWRSFWAGLLTLVFLGWAWNRSIRRYDSFVCCNATGRFGIILEQRDSVVVFTIPHKLPILPAFTSLHFILDQPRRHPRLPCPLAIGIKSPPAYRSLAIAHWFLILLFLVPWTAFLFWRSRRMKRLAAEAGEPQL